MTHCTPAISNDVDTRAAETAHLLRDETSLLHAFELRIANGLSLTDRFQVHIIELPKYVIPSDKDPITDPVEQWLYFFRDAANCTPEERQAYDDRLKDQRDEWASTAQTKLEGIKQGQQTKPTYRSLRRLR